MLLVKKMPERVFEEIAVVVAQENSERSNTCHDLSSGPPSPLRNRPASQPIAITQSYHVDWKRWSQTGSLSNTYDPDGDIQSRSWLGLPFSRSLPTRRKRRRGYTN